MSTSPEARAWMWVDADALRRNYGCIRASVGSETAIIPMVKADAYGLGVEAAVRVLAPEGPWGWGVATVDEGIRLRGLGIEAPIIVFSPLAETSFAAALASRLQVTVSSLDSLVRLAAAGREQGRVPEVHLDVDTGMGRTGFDWQRASDWMPGFLAEVASGVRWVGAFTHLHSAEDNDASVREQWGRFLDVLGRVPEPPAGLLVHVLNSAGSLGFPEFARDAVRPGIFLYGGKIGAGHPEPEAVASVHARVVHIREAAPGTTLGYGATYRAEGQERWATLSIGYADGVPRALGNRGRALVRGRAVPIIGRISMDMTVVDISGVPGVGVGDVGTLLGAEGRESITIDEVAELAGTISYEVLTGFTARVPRIWVGPDGS